MLRDIAGGLNKTLADVETLHIARNDVAATVFLHVDVEDSSRNRFELASRLEADLIALMHEGARDAEIGSGLPLSLQLAS